MVNIANMPLARPIGQTLMQKKAVDDEIARLRILLSNAVAQRGKHYTNLRAFTVRFAFFIVISSAGEKSRNRIMSWKCLASFEAEESSFSNKHLSWTLRSYFDAVIKDMEMQDGNTFIIGHFSGHAQLDIHERLIFSDADFRRQKPYHHTFTELYEEVCT